MKFLDRFIELPIYLIDSKNKEMGIKSDDIPAIAKVDPDCIEFYRTSLPNDDEEDQGEQTMVYFKSGEILIIELTVREFEKAIKVYELV